MWDVVLILFLINSELGICVFRMGIFSYKWVSWLLFLWMAKQRSGVLSTTVFTIRIQLHAVESTAFGEFFAALVGIVVCASGA